jgi:TolB protein
MGMAGTCVTRADPLSAAGKPTVGQIVFTSAGHSALVQADGSELRWLEFDVPDQATWQVADFFSDGTLLLLSMEPRRDGPGRPFDEYYTQTPTHLWRYDFRNDQLEELATVDRIAPFYTPALLIGDSQMLVQVVKNRVGQIYRMNLDGSAAVDFTRAGEGLPYGLTLSPDGKRVAFHLASPHGYQVWTSDLHGQNRQLIAAHPDHLYFGPRWSPDGQRIVYHDCQFRSDPGHDWSDLCINRSDGSEHRVLTRSQSQWFGATYGPAEAKGGGSNLPVWTPDSKVLFSRRMPNSKVPWEYQAGRVDTDHFNRDYKPELARGGTDIAQFDPLTNQVVSLTEPTTTGRWDFRPNVSPDGKQIAFCRAATGQVPTLWVMEVDGSDPKQIAVGRDGRGCDHPRWIRNRQ